MVINYKKLNPNGFYLLKYLNDETIRFIILYGGSSSGKSYSVAQTILIQTLQDGENTLVMRKVGASILKTIYEDYKVAAAGLGISHLFKFQQNTIKCLVNGAKIDFSGLDDPEKIKGISNYKRVQLEEWSEFEHPDFKQLRKRLRGKKGQQIICTFNPISESHWIKKEFIDKDKWHDVPMSVTIAGKELPEELTKVKSVKKNAPRQILNPRTKQIEEQDSNTVIIQSTYLNNFWVVGSPDGRMVSMMSNVWPTLNMIGFTIRIIIMCTHWESGVLFVPVASSSVPSIVANIPVNINMSRGCLFIYQSITMYCLISVCRTGK